MSVTLYVRNADLSKRDEDGRTPLMVAASKRNREVVKYIVGHRMNSRVIIEHLGQSPEDGIDGAGENMIVEELKACMQGAMSGHTDNAEGKCNEMVDDLLIAAVKTRNLKAVEVRHMFFWDISVFSMYCPFLDNLTTVRCPSI